MNASPELKAIFPEKTDFDIIHKVKNPCEMCYFSDGEEWCENYCVIGRLWKIAKQKIKDE